MFERVICMKWKNDKTWTEEDRRFYRRHIFCDDGALEYFASLVDEESEEHAVMRIERMTAISDHLDKMNKKLRSALEGYYFEGLTYQQIADRDGCSVSTAFKRCRRAEKWLKAQVAKGDV